ncbi:hypothetical protein [Brachybacterium atlanticum]|uniref:hypothetical protein n=1 Tax=Brachybacterium atlanticum TaxID=2911888 RepID=UPI0021DFFE18|nr:hypothetical protein [Brachybacterium atlanticum]
MTTTPSNGPRSVDVFGIMSSTAGGIGIALALWGQVVVAERYARHVQNGHPVSFDGIASVAPIPGFICAVLALVLGAFGLRTRRSQRVWAIAGIIAGVIAVACTVSGLPVSLLPDYSTPRNL